MHDDVHHEHDGECGERQHAQKQRQEELCGVASALLAYLAFALADDAFGFVGSLVETLHGLVVGGELFDVLKVFVQEPLVGELRLEVGVGVFVVLHREPAAQAAFLVFFLEGFLRVFEQLFHRGHIGVLVFEMIDRVDAEAFDDLHPRHLLEIGLVFRAGFLPIVVAVIIEAIVNPVDLLTETLALGFHEVSDVGTRFFCLEIECDVTDSVGIEIAIARLLFLLAPIEVPNIAFALVPTDVIDVVQRFADSFGCHGIMRIRGVVAEVDVRQRVDGLDAKYMFGGQRVG